MVRGEGLRSGDRHPHPVGLKARIVTDSNWLIVSVFGVQQVGSSLSLLAYEAGPLTMVDYGMIEA